MSSVKDFVIENDVLEKYTGPGGDVVIPEGVTTIWCCAFFDCSSLESVTIPESVTSIWDYAFSGCSSLVDITIPQSVTFISDSAFCGCKGLADEKGMVILRSILFDYFGSDTNAVIPEGVTTIEAGAFADCSSLNSVPSRRP